MIAVKFQLFYFHFCENEPNGLVKMMRAEKFEIESLNLKLSKFEVEFELKTCDS